MSTATRWEAFAEWLDRFSEHVPTASNELERMSASDGYLSSVVYCSDEGDEIIGTLYGFAIGFANRWISAQQRQSTEEEANDEFRALAQAVNALSPQDAKTLLFAMATCLGWAAQQVPQDA